jgi:ankyrin repeat protein
MLFPDFNVDFDDEEGFTTLESEFLGAVQEGKFELIEFLLNYSVVDSTVDAALQLASYNGWFEAVKLLLQDPRTDPTDEDNYPIRVASQFGRLQVVKLLLQDPRVDPAASNNYSIRFASYNGHLEVVKLLLQDQRVDPTADNNYAIKNAIRNGHRGVVDLLLKDPRIDPAIVQEEEELSGLSV